MVGWGCGFHYSTKYGNSRLSGTNADLAIKTFALMTNSNSNP